VGSGCQLSSPEKCLQEILVFRIKFLCWLNHNRWNILAKTEVHLIRGGQVECKMRTIGIVKMNSQANLRMIDKAISQLKLAFEDAGDTFSENVVVAVANGSHVRLDLVMQQSVHVGMTGVF